MMATWFTGAVVEVRVDACGWWRYTTFFVCLLRFFILCWAMLCIVAGWFCLLMPACANFVALYLVTIYVLHWNLGCLSTCATGASCSIPAPSASLSFAYSSAFTGMPRFLYALVLNSSCWVYCCSVSSPRFLYSMFYQRLFTGEHLPFCGVLPSLCCLVETVVPISGICIWWALVGLHVYILLQCVKLYINSVQCDSILCSCVVILTISLMTYRSIIDETLQIFLIYSFCVDIDRLLLLHLLDTILTCCRLVVEVFTTICLLPVWVPSIMEAVTLHICLYLACSMYGTPGDLFWYLHITFGSYVVLP
jgi:hypothetical protein